MIYTIVDTSYNDGKFGFWTVISPTGFRHWRGGPGCCYPTPEIMQFIIDFPLTGSYFEHLKYDRDDFYRNNDLLDPYTD